MLEKNEYRILLIGDDLEYADHLRSIFDNQAITIFKLERVSNFRDAAKSLHENHFDAVLLDFQLADLRDQPSLNAISELHNNLNGTALVGLIDNADEELARMAVKYGLQDRVTKNGFDERMLANKLLFAIKRATENPNLSINQDAFASEFLFDSRTGLPNKILFKDRLKQSVHRSNRSELSAALMIIKFKYFEVVNTYFGTPIGTEILKRIEKILIKNTRDSDTVAHTADDTFMIILENIEQANHITLLAERIIRAFSKRMHINSHDFKMTASAGLAIYPACNEEDMIKNAENAMHRSLEMGGNRYKIYNSKFKHEAIWKYNLEDDLQQALALNQFELHYQPLFDLNEQRVYGLEALLRWNHPKQGLLQPSAFIEELERSDTMLEVGSWVLDEACRHLKVWQTKYPYITINVNLTARQLDDPYLIERVNSVLEKHAIQAQHIELEITERHLVDKENSINQYNIQRLSDMGIKLALDDFGIGYSTEAYFNYFPANTITTIKIDRFDTFAMMKDTTIAERVRNYVSFSQGKNVRIIAEGIENEEQLRTIKQLGVHLIQGFLIGKPVSSSEIEDGLHRNQYVPDAITPSNKLERDLLFN